jgi:hypothetical protein
MVTIFSTPKAFRGHFGVIQRNAIGSWMRLSPAPQIILFGNSEGTSATAAEFGLEHVPSVETSEFGTPYLRSLIEGTERLARHPLLCYVNGDILFTEGFEEAIRHVAARQRFLMVGARMNLDLDVPIVFDANWRGWLRKEYSARGTVGDHTGIDFFAFPKGLYTKIPPLAIGRAWFDQWMIRSALEQRTAVIDASGFTPIVHQNHDYAHLDGGRESAYKGIEAQRNLALCGGEHVYTLLDCTHDLKSDGRLKRVRLRRLRFRTRQGLWNIFVHRTAGFRHALGLRRKVWRSEEKTSQGRVS